MANISWTSSSINSFFNTSLGNPSSAFSGIYNSLSDSAMIKSGSYYKLMDSYYKTVKTESAADKTTDTATKTETKKNTTVLDQLLSKEEKKSTVSNKILDELLSKEEKKSTVSNKVLDELLSSEKKDVTAATYDSTGAKTQTAASTIDQSI